MHAKVWKCTFRYSGVCKMYEVWGEGGGTISWGGGVATRDTEPYIYIYNVYIYITPDFSEEIEGSRVIMN